MWRAGRTGWAPADLLFVRYLRGGCVSLRDRGRDSQQILPRNGRDSRHIRINGKEIRSDQWAKRIIRIQLEDEDVVLCERHLVGPTNLNLDVVGDIRSGGHVNGQRVVVARKLGTASRHTVGLVCRVRNQKRTLCISQRDVTGVSRGELTARSIPPFPS